jgi:hypothetical protein
MVVVPTLDPTQTFTTEWVQACVPSLDQLCLVTHVDENGIAAWRCVVPQASQDQVARRVAIGIAARRLALVPDLFFDWFGKATGCIDSEVSADRLSLMQKYGLLVDVGTDTAPANDVRLWALIAESVLHELLWSVDHGLGRPILVEGHDWSALDHGGDKLALYLGDTGPAFRLWESKALTSTVRTATTVVADAADQLEVNAAAYLGRFAVTASRSIRDEALATFVAQLPRLWADNDQCAGIGVAVTTHDVPPTQACFAQLDAHFTLPNSNKAGQLALLGPLDAFKTSLRSILWKGAGLWTGP